MCQAPSAVMLPPWGDPHVSSDGPHPRVPILLHIFSPFWSFPAAQEALGMAAWQHGWCRFLPTFCLSHSIQVNRVMTYRDLDNDLMKYSAFQTLVSGQLLHRGAGAHRHLQKFLSFSQALQPLLCEALRLPGDNPFARDILLRY